MSSAPSHRDPLLSLVIPTRENCETLRDTLRTMVSQKTTAAEFIVSDNVSADATREVVEEVDDPRLTYIRTPRRLSMVDNFQFAYERARWRFLMFIGDNDAVMPGALAELESYAASGSSEIYHWWPHMY